MGRGLISWCSRNSAVKNITTLATGSASAQFIILLSTPIVTRIYGPESIGLQGLFLSLSAIMGAVAALGFPIAIVLPSEDSEALVLVKLSALVAATTSLATALLLWIVGFDFLEYLNADALGSLIYLLPVMMLVIAFTSITNHWLARKSQFFVAAKLSIRTAILTNSSRIGLGLLQPLPMSLIASVIMGATISILVTSLESLRKIKNSGRRLFPKKGSHVNLLNTWISYKDFPLFRAPQDFINTISQHLPVLVLASLFGAKSAGQYSIAFGVLAAPTALLGNAVLSAFYPRITELAKKNCDVAGYIIRATLILSAIFILPFLCVSVFGVDLFTSVFGPEWTKAGEYAQWLSVWLFFQLLNRPSVAAIPILGLQSGLLLYEVFSTGAKLLALWIGFRIFENEVMSIALYSVSGVVAYLCLIVWVVFASRDSARYRVKTSFEKKSETPSR